MMSKTELKELMIIGDYLRLDEVLNSGIIKDTTYCLERCGKRELCPARRLGNVRWYGYVGLN